MIMNSLLPFQLESDLSNFTKYIRKSDTDYIKPRKLPAIENPQQIHRLKNFKKLDVLEYRILEGKIHSICERIKIVRLTLDLAYSEIDSIVTKYTSLTDVHPIHNISKNGYKRFQWKLGEERLYIGTSDKENVSIELSYNELFEKNENFSSLSNYCRIHIFNISNSITSLC